MAKDDRLYARFDIAMDEHPKVMLLSDAGFRALVEATLYSRRQLTDGFLAARIAERKWGRDVITELTGNDPERPSWKQHVKDGVDGYMIHDFAEHQTTNADIEAKREAGRRGGLAKAAKRGSTSLAPATDLLEQKASTTPSAPLAITETETETETTQLLLSDADASDAGTLLDDSWRPNQKHIDLADSLHLDKQRTFERFVDHARRNHRRQKNWNTAFTNWLQKDAQFAQQRQGAPVPSSRPTAAQRAASLVGTFSTDQPALEVNGWT